MISDSGLVFPSKMVQQCDFQEKEVISKPKKDRLMIHKKEPNCHFCANQYGGFEIILCEVKN